MENTSDLLISFRSFIAFADSLRGMSASLWSRPLQPGKWSICGIMGHIMLWDRHFMEHAINPIACDAALTLKHSDFDAFNAQAAAYAESVEQGQLIDGCILQRQQLLAIIETLSPERLQATYTDGDGNPFSIRAYLTDFIDHDRHHRLQIEHVLNG